MEEITTSLRRPDRKPSPGKERVTAMFPGGHRRTVLRFSSQAPRLRTTDIVFLGTVGGWNNEGFKVPELDVARREG